MRGYRVTVLRHGATEATQRGVYIGVTDYPLSSQGKAELYAKRAEFEYPNVDMVYSSPLKRCTETARILFPDNEIKTLDAFRELDFGEFDGKSVDELVELDEFKHWLKGGMHNAPPKGESVSQLIERTYAGIRDLFIEMTEKGIYHCALISHSGVIANLMACFGLPKNPPSEYTCESGEGFDIMLTTQLWHQAQAFEILGKAPYLKD